MAGFTTDASASSDIILSPMDTLDSFIEIKLVKLRGLHPSSDYSASPKRVIGIPSRGLVVAASLPRNDPDLVA